MRFGWDHLHHAWSKDGVAYNADVLFKHFVDVMLPEVSRRGIPDESTMDLPSRKSTPQLGTRTADLDVLDQRYENEKQAAIEDAIQMQNQLIDDGVVDRHEKLQPSTRPELETLINTEVEILYEYVEPDESVTLMWCQGVVVSVRTQDRVHIE